ncbi:MAG TPA: hypothetical protein VF761_00515 [Gemmatimonadaceae bacterium]
MRILAVNECWAWCREHGVALDEQDRPVFDPALTHRARLTYVDEPGHGIAVRPEVVAAIEDALGRWDECLLWLTLWGVWPSSENWPVYYGLRGNLGERRSIDEAPGHLATAASDRERLAKFLELALNHAWEGHVFAARGTETYTRVFISHDEWVSVASRHPFALSAPAV